MPINLLPKLLHGADYNYEQWIDYPEVIEADFRFMNEAHCNCMIVGIFSWAKLEPQENIYHFDWLDELLDRLTQNSMYAVLATPSGSKPIWLSHKYPEVCRVDKMGQREPHGSRHNHCRTSPIYREKVLKLNSLLANRYKNHPALLLWHVSNEYNAGHCYCDFCLKAFQGWLEIRYGSIEELNKAWWTTFWSHTFTSWDQILPYDTSIHGLMLDWLRFQSDQTLDFFLEESRPLKEITPHIPITTNFMLPNVGLDYWKFSKHVDIVSWDSYPQWHVHEEEWREAVKTGFYHDLYRSMKQQPFMLMESTPNVTNWQGMSVPKRENMHVLSSLQAIAHGSDTVQYFQWRQSRGGEEKFHSAVISHHGRSDTQVFQNVKKVGSILREIEEVKGNNVQSRVAILYDFQSEWAINLAQLPNNVQKKYQERLISHYQAFWKKGIPVDLVDSSSDYLREYDVVIAPMLYMVRNDLVSTLKNFVMDGGIFITTYLSGVVDDSDLVFLGGCPGPLKELLGLWVEDTDTIPNHQTYNLEFLNKSYEVIDYADKVRLESAQVIATFSEGYLRNYPAITKNSYGKGFAYYLASRNSEVFYDEFYHSLFHQHNLQITYTGVLPLGTTVRQRVGAKSIFTFYMNFTSEHQVIDKIHQVEKLVHGTNSDPYVIKIGPYDMVITKQPI